MRVRAWQRAEQGPAEGWRHQALGGANSAQAGSSAHRCSGAPAALEFQLSNGRCTYTLSCRQHGEGCRVASGSAKGSARCAAGRAGFPAQMTRIPCKAAANEFLWAQWRRQRGTYRKARVQSAVGAQRRHIADVHAGGCSQGGEGGQAGRQWAGGRPAQIYMCLSPAAALCCHSYAAGT